MIVDRRRVERLSLKVSRPEESASATDTIREALRIASMPGDGQPGRLFIRRLDLGVIRLDAGPRPIARWMESELRALRRRAIPIADPRAAGAEVVIARDPLEPLVVALAEAAAGRRLSAWYWPRVDTRLSPSQTPREVAAIVWSLLAEHPDAPACVPAVVEAVLEGERAAEVLAAIDPLVGQRLASRLGGPVIPADATPAVIDALVVPRWRALVRQLSASWARDVRGAWLVSVATQAAHPRFSRARLERRVREVMLAQAPPLPPPPPHAAPLVEERSVPDSPPSSPAVEEGAPPESHQASTSASPPAPEFARPIVESTSPAEPSLDHSTPERAEPRPDEPTTAPEPAPPEARRWMLFPRPQPTRYGGLYFVLRPLARLGLETFLAEHPELEDIDFGVRVLRRIADHLDIAADEPIRAALELPDSELPERVPQPPAFEGVWTDAVPAPTPAGLDPLDDLIEAWHAGVAAWLDRHAQLALTTLVTRDAAVSLSRTHLDLIFDMEASDLQIRKAALDVDPGWVRWLGRVVQFHYVHGGLLDD